ncbi:hypothetical protein P3L10_028738 [Capsicum annuum]
MDQTKNQKNESLKQEIRRLRQQMTEMHRAWASGLSPPPFPFIDPTNTSSFPPKSESQFSTIVYAPQHDSEFIPSQKHLNTSTTFPLAPQHKPATFTTPHVVCDLVAQSSTGTSALAHPTVVRPHVASELIFNTFSNHCYTLEPDFKLTEPPKFLNKKSSVPKESEKMVEKIKSTENAMKNSLGPMGKENVSYKDWGMSLSANLPPIFEMSKFEEQDGHEKSMKYLGQYCNQLREPGGKKNEKDDTAIVVGERAHPRKRCRRCRQSQAQVHTQAFHNHSRNSLYYVFPPPYLGDSIEDCRALKGEIEKMIQDKLIMVQNIDSEENSSHADMQTSG